MLAKLTALCKRRGFIFQSSEIYGGINGCWDYGPVGVALKNNIKNSWWYDLVQLRDNVEGMDASIIMHPDVWKASGHVDGFNDPMIDCKKCKMRFREDHIDTEKCPNCGGELTEAKQFNLMFKTQVGASEDSGKIAYLRPETAQGIFVNFKVIQTISRQKLPFGIAQMGKAFRNEINPRNFIFRSREFEQMELEFFINPKEDEKWMEYWLEERMNWWKSLGVNPEKLRLRPHGKDELAHYAKACYDVEYEFPFGWQELEGIANRSDFDLTQHKEVSGKDPSYFDDATKEKFIPAVIESSLGVDRTMLTLICDAYNEEKVNDETRVVLKFKPGMAPIQIGVFPLMKKLKEPAKKLEMELRKHFRTFYDDRGNIGKRYRRQDEIGTPYIVTIDPQTEEDKKVTVRDRDTMEQERVNIDSILDYLKTKFED